LRKSFIKVLPEVADALSSGRPVVALESTIVAHGMPYPQNLDLAKDVSWILREKVSVEYVVSFFFFFSILRLRFIGPNLLFTSLCIFFICFFQGVIPATIAVKNGVFRVGLEADEMVNLSMAGEEGRAMKCSTRDLPLVAAPEHGCSTADEKTQWGGMFSCGVCIFEREIFSFPLVIGSKR
jgi:pseudouridine-5'-phosphate glycosidase